MKNLLLGRWKFTIVALVIAVVGTLVYQFWYRRVPSPAELDAYTVWADGLADRSGRVTDPRLVAPAVDVATAANDFVGKLREISATPRAPGAPPPPAVYQLSILNDRITADLGELTRACRR